ncbi:MAG TPA: hypothetical protein VGK73_03960 [Polyangiaceae bacterium]
MKHFARFEAFPFWSGHDEVPHGVTDALRGGGFGHGSAACGLCGRRGRGSDELAARPRVVEDGGLEALAPRASLSNALLFLLRELATTTPIGRRRGRRGSAALLLAPPEFFDLERELWNVQLAGSVQRRSDVAGTDAVDQRRDADAERARGLPNARSAAGLDVSDLGAVD